MFRVMIVDDEPSAISSIKRNLLRSNPTFEVHLEAYSVDDAIAKLEGKQVDIIFTDIRMPGKIGIELVRYLAKNYPNIVVVVVSGYDDYDYVREAFLCGVEDYLLKPMQPDKFVKMMNNLETKLLNKDKVINLDERLRIKEQDGNSNKSMAETMIDQIEDYLINHLEKDNSIITICTRFNISQPYLSKIFKKYKKCTYNDFLNNLKIETAKRLLKERQDLLVGNIAMSIGFSDQFYFSKVFKGVVGITPTEFRKQVEGISKV